MNKKTSFLMLAFFITLTNYITASEQSSLGSEQSSLDNEIKGNKAKMKSVGCVFCHKKGTTENPLKKCGQCKVTFYCSKKCQKKGWAEGHKGSCYKLGVLFKTIDPKTDPKALTFTLPQEKRLKTFKFPQQI